MGKENLFEQIADTLYIGNELDTVQRYRANSIIVVQEMCKKTSGVNLTTDDCLELGKTIDQLCSDAYGQGLADGISFGCGMNAHAR